LELGAGKDQVMARIEDNVGRGPVGKVSQCSSVGYNLRTSPGRPQLPEVQYAGGNLELLRVGQAGWTTKHGVVLQLADNCR
jgi:hypothetical protein